MLCATFSVGILYLFTSVVNVVADSVYSLKSAILLSHTWMLQTERDQLL